MAEKIFKVNEPIEIVYQAPNAESGLVNVRADIYDENHALFSVDNPLTEVGNSGSYHGEFTPDVQGEWEAVIYKFIDSSTRDGQVVKRYSVGAHNVHSIGQDVTVVDGKANNIQTKVNEIDADVDAVKLKTDNLPSDPASNANVDEAETNIRSDIADLDTKVSSLDTPPMVS